MKSEYDRTLVNYRRRMGVGWASDERRMGVGWASDASADGAGGGSGRNRADRRVCGM